MDIVVIKIDKSIAEAIYSILLYITTVAYYIDKTWIKNDGALLMEQEYSSCDVHILEYHYIAKIKIVYTYSDSEFRNVRCYDDNKMIYSGSVLKGISESSEFKPVFTKKVIDMTCGFETMLDIWPTGCVTHRSCLFDKLYNPFIEKN